MHSVPAPVLAASSASAEMQQGGNGGYPYNLTLAQRIDAFIPTHMDVPSSLPRKGCSGWTMHDFDYEAGVTLAEFSTGVSEAPWNGERNSPTDIQTTGSLSASAETNTTQVGPSTRQSGKSMLENETKIRFCLFL